MSVSVSKRFNYSHRSAHGLLEGAVVKGDRNFHVIRQLNSGQNLEMINPRMVYGLLD